MAQNLTRLASEAEREPNPRWAVLGTDSKWVVQTASALLGPNLAWLLTGLVLAIDLCWLLWNGWSVSREGLLAKAIVIGAFLSVLAIGRYRRDARLRTTILAVVLMIVFMTSAGTLSYLAVGTKAPLVDASLAAFDRTLGFDWMALHMWLQAHPTAAMLLRQAYCSGLMQMAFVIFFLGFSLRHDALQEFLRLFILATLVTVLVSGLFPAAGAWKFYGIAADYNLSSLDHFELLRSGQMREVPIGRLQGLISIPSLHAAMAVLLMYAVRGARWLLPFFVLLNLAMLAATPADGSHYLVDVIAGIALALLLILFERRRGRQALLARGRISAKRWGSLQR